MSFYARDPKTGELEEIEEDIDTASGVDRARPAVQRIGLETGQVLAHKESGEEAFVPDSELKEALGTGAFHIAGTGPGKRKARQMGSGESAARGFANSATMGFSDEIAGAGEAAVEALKGNFGKVGDTYRAVRDEYRAQDDDAWDQNPGAYGAGFAGAVLPTLAAGAARTAGLTGAQRASQALQTGGRAGAVSGLGGGTSAEGQADLTRGELSKAIHQTGTGTFLGGLMGVGGEKLSQALQRTAPKLESVAAQSAAKASGADSAKANRLIDRMPGGREAYGRDLLNEKIVTGGASVSKIAERAAQAADAAGEEIGSIMHALDQNIRTQRLSGIAMQNVRQRIQNEVLAPLEASPATHALAKRVRGAYVEPFDATLGNKNLGFEALWNERRLLDKTAYTESGLDKPLNAELQKIRGIMNDELMKAAEQTLGQTMPDVTQRLRDANRRYSVAVTAKKLAGERETRDFKNRAVSLTDYLSGGAAGAAGAAAFGPAGIAAAPITTGLNWVARHYGRQSVADFANRLAQLVKNNPEALGKYLEPVKQLLVRGGMAPAIVGEQPQ